MPGGVVTPRVYSAEGLVARERRLVHQDLCGAQRIAEDVALLVDEAFQPKSGMEDHQNWAMRGEIVLVPKLSAAFVPTYSAVQNPQKSQSGQPFWRNDFSGTVIQAGWLQNLRSASPIKSLNRGFS